MQQEIKRIRFLFKKKDQFRQLFFNSDSVIEKPRG